MRLMHNVALGTTTKGKPMLVSLDYKYDIHKKVTHNIYWTCFQKYTTKCKDRLITSNIVNNKVIILGDQNNLHSHSSIQVILNNLIKSVVVDNPIIRTCDLIKAINKFNKSQEKKVIRFYMQNKLHESKSESQETDYIGWYYKRNVEQCQVSKKKLFYTYHLIILLFDIRNLQRIMKYEY